jgi:small subunit ribosomal protein S2
MLLASVTMKELLEAGVHFGHPTRRWNPKMKRFIYGGRNGIYIIDLHQTLQRIEHATEFARQVSLDGGIVLLVGTKRQAQESVRAAAESCGMPHITFRWPGGFLTNFRTLRRRIDDLEALEKQVTPERLEPLPKRQAKRLREDYERLNRMLGGVRDLERLPDALFLVDLRKEHIAVEEARRLGIPTIAVVDTDRDPDLVTYPIPSNDDAIRAIRLISNIVAEAVSEGRREREARLRAEEVVPEAVPAEAAAAGAPAAPAAEGLEAPALVGVGEAETTAEEGVAEPAVPARQPRTFRKRLVTSEDEFEDL